MKSQHVFLVLNGEKPTKLPDLSVYDIVCATDGAYDFLNEKNISPHFVSGDFDSIKTLPSDIENIQTPNQDLTDFDKILQILYDRKGTIIDVYGASGKEQDHFLGNLHTALQWKDRLTITFYDDFGRYFFCEKSVIVTNCHQKTISLLPFPIATEINTQGLQYPLHKEDLTFGTKIGTRNFATEKEVKIEFESGELLIFINH